jgi:hypothetical protein
MRNPKLPHGFRQQFPSWLFHSQDNFSKPTFVWTQTDGPLKCKCRAAAAEATIGQVHVWPDGAATAWADGVWICRDFFDAICTQVVTFRRQQLMAAPAHAGQHQLLESLPECSAKTRTHVQREASVFAPKWVSFFKLPALASGQIEEPDLLASATKQE